MQVHVVCQLQDWRAKGYATWKAAVEWGYACGLWQLCLHKLGPCGFSAFFYVTLVTHVTPRGVRVPGLPQLITSRHRLGMSHLVQDVEAKRQVRYRSR